MGVVLLNDQHDRHLLAFKPFDESGLFGVGSPAPLNVPGGLCVDRQGNVIIADTGNHCLAIWDLWGTSWQTFGSQGVGHGEFFSPSDVTTSSSHFVVVVDSGNRRLVRMDDLDGNGWITFGTAGKPTTADPVAFGKFADPRCIAFDRRDCLYITDPAAKRVIRIDTALDGSGWTELPLPSGANPLQPLGVAVGSGQLAVSDVGNRRVHVFDSEDVLIATLDGLTAGFAMPAYLAYDDEYLVVADIVRNELRRFRLHGSTFVLEDLVRGTSPARVTPLFQQIGGIASGDS
jgi:NHL repeat